MNNPGAKIYAFVQLSTCSQLTGYLQDKVDYTIYTLVWKHHIIDSSKQLLNRFCGIAITLLLKFSKHIPLSVSFTFKESKKSYRGGFSEQCECYKTPLVFSTENRILNHECKKISSIINESQAKVLGLSYFCIYPFQQKFIMGLFHCVQFHTTDIPQSLNCNSQPLCNNEIFVISSQTNSFSRAVYKVMCYHRFHHTQIINLTVFPFGITFFLITYNVNWFIWVVRLFLVKHNQFKIFTKV